MQMSTEQMWKYPNVALYLHVIKSSVVGNEKVWSAFKEWSTLSDEQARECLTYGTVPILRIADSIYANGHFSSSQPSYINVGQKYAHAVQTASEGRAFEHIKALEAIILHELCHWGRHLNSEPDEYYYETGKTPKSVGSDVIMVDAKLELDSGDMFKRKAYSNPWKPHLG